MVFQDVAFLPSCASFSTTLATNCGSVERLRIAACLRTVFGDKQGYAPCEIFLLQQGLFLCQLYFMEIIQLIQR